MVYTAKKIKEADITEVKNAHLSVLIQDPQSRQQTNQFSKKTQVMWSKNKNAFPI